MPKKNPSIPKKYQGKLCFYGRLQISIRGSNSLPEYVANSLGEDIELNFMADDKEDFLEQKKRFDRALRLFIAKFYLENDGENWESVSCCCGAPVRVVTIGMDAHVCTECGNKMNVAWIEEQVKIGMAKSKTQKDETV